MFSILMISSIKTHFILKKNILVWIYHEINKYQNVTTEPLNTESGSILYYFNFSLIDYNYETISELLIYYDLPNIYN